MDDKPGKKSTATEFQTPTGNVKVKNEKESEFNTMRKNNNRATDTEKGADEEELKAQASDEGSEEINALKEELDAAKKEAKDFYDRLLRATAEFENYKKRAQRQGEEQRKFANEALLKDLLSVVDNLERAVTASVQNQDQNADATCMLEGVEMTLTEIHKILERYNVTPIEAQGKPFDPTYHEAVMQEPSEEYPENTVKNELQKGYLLHDRLIRPAMVVVSKGDSTS